jgi:hypothetical protein
VVAGLGWHTPPIEIGSKEWAKLSTENLLTPTSLYKPEYPFIHFWIFTSPCQFERSEKSLDASFRRVSSSESPTFIANYAKKRFKMFRKKLASHQKDLILEKYQEIQGVCWVSNVHVVTGSASGILLSGAISTNVVRQAGFYTEYAVWGIHIATDDHLTFISKADDKPIVVKMVDCRKGSPTQGNYLEVVCRPDISRRLVIPRGVAHLPLNVNGLITNNSPKIYWDWRKRPVYYEMDVINVEKNRPLDKFPVYEICNYSVPQFLYPFMLHSFKTRHNPNYQAPFIFERQGTLYVLRKKSGKIGSGF